MRYVAVSVVGVALCAHWIAACEGTDPSQLPGGSGHAGAAGRGTPPGTPAACVAPAVGGPKCTGRVTLAPRAQSLSTANHLRSLVLVDLDGDHDLDIATVSEGAGLVETFLNDGTGSFLSAAVASMGDNLSYAVAGDWDRSRRPQWIWVLVIWMVTGALTSQWPTAGGAVCTCCSIVASHRRAQLIPSTARSDLGRAGASVEDLPPVRRIGSASIHPLRARPAQVDMIHDVVAHFGTRSTCCKHPQLARLPPRSSSRWFVLPRN
jgi:hypothetical protein